MADDLEKEQVRALVAFGHARVQGFATTTFKDLTTFLDSLVPDLPAEHQAAFTQLRADVLAKADSVKDLTKTIEDNVRFVAKAVKDTQTELALDPLPPDAVLRTLVRTASCISGMDASYDAVASQLAKGAGATVDAAKKTALMALWDPWTKLFRNLATGAGNLLDALGTKVFGKPGLVKEIGDHLTLTKSPQFLLAATVTLPGTTVGPVRLDESTVEVFLNFTEIEVPNPTEAQKADLVARDKKFFRGETAIFGVRVRSKIGPPLKTDVLSKKAGAAKDPEPTSHTAITLDTAEGFYLGDIDAKTQKAVLPLRLSTPGFELREVALGLNRNAAKEVTGFEITASVNGRFGDAVGVQVVGAGFVITFPEEDTPTSAMWDLAVALRWPDQLGLKIKAGPVAGGGFVQRVEREYKQPDGSTLTQVEFGGVVQLKILEKISIYALVVVAPEPFSMVLVFGVRFDPAIPLSMGFTLNGLGGLVGIDRRINLDELRKGMKDHVIDQILFPEDPLKDASKLIDKVAQVFPPQAGSFVFGPIAELGWGQGKKFVEVKLGVVFQVPDFLFVLLGSLRVRAPDKKVPVTDVRAEVYVVVTPDYLELYARMRDSTIAQMKISGDLGLYIAWTGEGAFELSVGGFHPEYEKLVGSKPHLKDLERVTIDLSPTKQISFVIKAYLAVTAGSVQLGVEGRFHADFAIASAKAWLVLDIIFIWAPRFAFKVSIEVGIEVEIFGLSLASVTFRGSLAGDKPFVLEGHIKVSLFLLPDIDEDLGPVEWGERPAPVGETQDALQLALTDLDSDDAWTADLPEHAAQLVTLQEATGVEGLVAHPLAALQAIQSAVPLNVRISHVGSSPVKADMVTIGDPATSGTATVATVSEALTPFAPGQYFDLEGEKLLARSGFEHLVGGVRLAAATTPVVGAAQAADVVYRTFVRDDDEDRMVLRDDVVMAALPAFFAGQSVAARAVPTTANPYQPRPPEPAVTVAPAGTATIAGAFDGAALVGGLGALSSTEAGLVADALVHGGVAATVVAAGA
ncbi:DUF6603 domain-containing protein [Isoptericola sp. QY 916]|uniref:DUF6603 domain-containing protein n=1 Tax=Isoptericola sp. QY 916 TaxID=2782570 RepID=UPI003D2FCE6D|nr:hypothetical protein [Isoptericola sp. QY 916]